MLTMMLLSGCATTGQEIDKPTVREIIKESVKVVDTACKWVSPIYISKSDTLTAGTARQILTHNETWKANCDGLHDKSRE